ncbi:hypothetical protein HPO93_22460 [Citrobacter braakii]
MMKLLLIPLLLISLNSQAQCWVIANMQGYGAFSGDEYKFDKDGIGDGVFQVSINGDKASVYNVRDGYVPDMSYAALSENTMMGAFQAGGGITVETWSITKDKKVLYTKVMNIPGMQKMTSTKTFVGDVVGTCKD